MQGTRLQSSCRKRHSYQALLCVLLLLGAVSTASSAAYQDLQPVTSGANDVTATPGGSPTRVATGLPNHRDYVASEIFLLPEASDVKGFRTSPAHDESSLNLTAVGYLDKAGEVEEFGTALLVNIVRYPVKQEQLLEPVAIDQANSSLHSYEIIRLTGELIGDGGSVQIYGVEIVSSYEVDGVKHKVTAFDLLGVGDSRYELDNAASAHTNALNNRFVPDLTSSGIPAAGIFDDNAGTSGFSFTPPTCDTCGDDWNAAVNQCDFVANLCVAGVSVAHLVAAVACPATSPILFAACIAAVDISYTLGLANCAYNLNTCFNQAARDLDNCNRTCDGSPGALP